MKPADFREFVYELAEKVDLPRERIILGGDHLGPLTWTEYEEEKALSLATQLVYDYVRAGFTKIHLDTSMRLANDSTEKRLSDEVIARRSAQLAQASLQAFADLQEENPDAVFPAFIIGSEVPIPGGAQEKEDSVAVTSVDDFKTTYQVFKETFKIYDVEKVFDAVIAVVVQPGVEFGDDDIVEYDREKAYGLTRTLKK